MEECLTRDRSAAGSSLTGVTALHARIQEFSSGGIQVNTKNALTTFFFVVVVLVLRPLAGYGLPPPTPRGNFVDHIFLEAQCLASILQHISPSDNGSVKL